MSRNGMSKQIKAVGSAIFTMVFIGSVFSGCTKANGPGNQSMESPSTGRSMVRVEKENREQYNNPQNAVSRQNTVSQTPAQQMNQCQDMMRKSLDNPNMAFDKQYIDTMIRHHQGAIDMAQDAKQKAQHAEVKQLSQNIIDTQQKEIQKLKDWRQKWYGSESEKSASQ